MLPGRCPQNPCSPHHMETATNVSGHCPMFSDTEGYKNAPSWEPLLLYYGSIMPFNKFSSQNFRNASSFLNQIFVLTNWWTVLKTKYSWPLNNMGLNYMGPLIHGYFSTVRNTVLYGTSGYRGPALKLCLDESPHCSRVNSVVLQSLWEKTRRFCKLSAMAQSGM